MIKTKFIYCHTRNGIQKETDIQQKKCNYIKKTMKIVKKRVQNLKTNTIAC